MRAPDRSGLRLLRAVVLAGSSTALGGLAHTRAGAVEIGPGSVLALLAVLALSWVATARRVTWPVIALVLAGGQALTHLALTAGHAGGLHLHGSGAAALPVVEPADGRMAAAAAGEPSLLAMLVATVVAFGIGFAMIAWFMRLIENHSYMVFVVYRLVAGLLLLVLLWTGVVDPLGGA